MNEAVSLQHVSFTYNKTAVLKDVCLTIAKGEFLGIIGPNGGGKTTLLKLIMGLLEAQEGTIVLEEGMKIGYVPQRLPFDRHFPMSVLELVLGGLLSEAPWFGGYGRKNKNRALHALEHVDLLNEAHAHCGSLSGGQLQRALIARAIVSHPHLLLLDEPTANIDHQAEEHLWELLNQFKGKMAIGMVTHDLDAAVNRVDRIVCVHRTVYPLPREEVCKHFALGLYHKEPLNQ
ncbi:MAG: metal ABC transporter ATP-binding protein [Verrucomicrobia bacterium]|nr:metal ABC transporter ATP-binding protein [Verrucomicrobiota bacterium]